MCHPVPTVLCEYRVQKTRNISIVKVELPYNNKALRLYQFRLSALEVRPVVRDRDRPKASRKVRGLNM